MVKTKISYEVNIIYLGPYESELFDHRTVSFFFNWTHGILLHVSARFMFITYFLQPLSTLYPSAPPPPLFFYTFSLCVCQFLSLSLSHSPFVSLLLLLPSSSFFLVSFEVLNNERAALPVKLIEKSRLKLLGTVHHSWILSSGPHVDEKGGGSIRSIVSMRWQWLHRALIPLAETQTTSAQHGWWALISRECFFLPLLLWMLNLDISWHNV